MQRAENLGEPLQIAVERRGRRRSFLGPLLGVILRAFRCALLCASRDSLLDSVLDTLLSMVLGAQGRRQAQADEEEESGEGTYGHEWV
jgi:hypothetical protein